MRIGNFNSDNNKVFIIAELSANHNGSIKTAIETIKAVKRSGADCIKLQTYTADTITLNQIINPIRGSIAYVNSDKSIYVYDGTEWKSLMYPPIKSFYLSQDTLGGIVAYIYLLK